MSCPSRFTGTPWPDVPLTPAGYFGVTSNPSAYVNCRVCGGISYTHDTDGRAGVIGITISFGQNLLQGVPNQAGIDSYKVFAVDTCHRKLTEALATVTTNTQLSTSCCNVAAYSTGVTLNPIPSGFAYFMVVPHVQGFGALPVGPVTGTVPDVETQTTSSCHAAVLSMIIAVLVVLDLLFAT